MLDVYPEKIDAIETSTSVVNGVLEEYYASTDRIDTNTFVEFVGQASMVGGAVSLGNYTTPGVAVETIDDTHVAILYSASGTIYPMIVVATLGDDGVTLGTSTVLSTSSNSGRTILGLKKVGGAYLALYGGGGSSSSPSYYRYLTLITISSGYVVSVGNTSYNGDRNAAINGGIELIDDSHVLLVEGTTSSATAVVKIATVSDGLLSVSDKLLSWTGGEPGLYARLSPSRFLVSGGGSYRIISVDVQNGTASEISVVGDIRWASVPLTIYRVIPLSSNRIGCMAVHTSIQDRQIGYFEIDLSDPASPSIVGAVDLGTGYGVTSTVNKTGYIGLCRVGNGVVVAIIDQLRVGTVLVTIATTSMTVLSVTTLYSDTSTSGTSLGNNVIICTNGETLAAIGRLSSSVVGAYMVDTDVQMIESNTHIDGLTKTACTTETPGKVWVLGN